MSQPLPREKILLLFDVDGTLTDPRLVRSYLLVGCCRHHLLCVFLACIRADATVLEGAAHSVRLHLHPTSHALGRPLVLSEALIL